MSNSSLDGLEPVKMGYVLWKGTWKSDVYPTLANGTLIAMTKPVGKISQPYEATAVVCYDGVYKGGIRIPFKVTVSPDDHSLNSNRPEHSMKGIIGDNQKISYKFTDISPNKILGTYKSENPNDQGKIELVPSNEMFIDTRPRKNALKELISSIFA